MLEQNSYFKPPYGYSLRIPWRWITIENHILSYNKYTENTSWGGSSLTIPHFKAETMNKILAYVDDAMSNFTFITWYYTYQWRFSVDLLIMKKVVNVYVDYFRPIILFKVDVKTITISLA